MRRFPLTLFILLLPLLAQAQKPKTVRPVYDVDFTFRFDNREMDAGEETYTRSMTINAARLTPSVGFEVRPDRRWTHRVMLGLDVFKNMGENPVTVPAAAGSSEADPGLENTRLIRELTLWYQFDAKWRKARLSGVFGAYPRKLALGDYSRAFYSDSLRFFDNNFEGALFQLQTPKLFCEIGCDWKGHQARWRREQFVIFTYGAWSPEQWLTLGWTGTFTHFAGSEMTPGVVDNNLLEPFIRVDAGPYVKMQELSLKLGWLQAMQQDRVARSGLLFPGGVECVLEAMHWNVGVRNSLYAGKNLMPLYTSYSSQLYMGSPFYRTGREAGKSGVYDCAEAWWQPHLADFVDLRVGVAFHFCGGFQGHQEVVSLVFNLDRAKTSFLNRKK